MFIIARTATARPSLMHKLNPRDHSITICGVIVTGWSRAYLKEAIPQVLCKRCKAAGDLA